MCDAPRGKDGVLRDYSSRFVLPDEAVKISSFPDRWMSFRFFVWLPGCVGTKCARLDVNENLIVVVYLLTGCGPRTIIQPFNPPCRPSHASSCIPAHKNALFSGALHDLHH